ncbi:MAG: hypothetical protein JSW26_03450 [Desulfobacterales bacterium]|nr:MAG: hypothetical protein JSW26_03450 [Desulfobacterales bacterium]
MRFNAIAILACSLFLTLFVAVGFGAQDDAQPSAFFPETNYEFSPVLDGTSVIHDFVIQNKGTGTLKVERVKTG